VVTGALGNVDIGGRQLIKFGGQGFVADTEDGGATPWLCALNGEGEDLKRYESVVAGRGPGAKELPADWPQSSTLPELKAKEEESVPIRCKCGGVDLVLQRGDYKHMAEDQLPSNVEPVSRKLKAGFCGCNSCRLQSGNDVFNWTYAETKYISFGKDSTKDFPSDMYVLNELIDAKYTAVC